MYRYCVKRVGVKAVMVVELRHTAQETTPILTTARQEDDKGDTSNNCNGFDDDLWEWVSKKQRQKEERGQVTSATNQQENDGNIHTGAGKGGEVDEEDEDKDHVNRDLQQ